MGEQDDIRPQLVSRVPQGVIPSTPSCPFRPTLSPHLHSPHLHGVKPQPPALHSCCLSRLPRPLLQPMVDHHGPGGEAKLRGLKRNSRSQRQGVSSPGARNKHSGAPREISQGDSRRLPHPRNGGVKAGPRRSPLSPTWLAASGRFAHL
jgi:hypothetical protein